MVDSDIKPSMAFLYGDIMKAKDEIKAGFQNIDRPGNLNAYNNVIEIIEEKMKDRLDTPLHLAAYFLNPYYSYNNDSIFTNELVMDGFITAVETFYHGDYDKQSKVLNEELPKFRDKQGHFGKPVAKEGCKKYDFDPGWLVECGDEDDGEPVCGLTWKLIEEACGVEECGKLRRSARLAQMREVNEDEIESEVEEATNEEDIDFESDQEDVVPLVGDDEQDGDNE
ncbi:hypothetical protein E2562_006420 [Oryza meyeriana var. granulata]|uniref:Uncharacterized protein n=1 Tax=Oryza meyeriana var. granulata TaxID=110450 RepID=A0A6G1EFH1_9ORYZ|nr:hypothetical protein E2562_006420 [Oryza meyeriana var. granulata]